MAGSTSDSRAFWKKYRQDAVMQIFGGTCGGMCGKFVEYPFDTVKVRLQTQPTGAAAKDGAVLFKGPIDCLVKTFKNEGFLGFYKGIASPMAGAMFENAAGFFMYSQAKMLLQGYDSSKVLSLPQVALAGAFSGIGTATVLCPVELVKCRLQIQQSAANAEYKNTLDAVLKIFKKDGIKGMFTGYGSTLVREIPGNTCWFGTYETVVRAVCKYSNTPRSEAKLHHTIVAGACAGMMYWAVPYPADAVKSRMQTGIGLGEGGKSQSFGQVAKHIAATEGVKGFYKGAGITVLRAAPANAVIFSTFEFCCRFWERVVTKTTPPK